MDFVKTEEAIDRACRKYLVKAWEERKVIHEQWAEYVLPRISYQSTAVQCFAVQKIYC